MIAVSLGVAAVVCWISACVTAYHLGMAWIARLRVERLAAEESARIDGEIATLAAKVREVERAAGQRPRVRA